jgi:hypothetical protein
MAAAAGLKWPDIVVLEHVTVQRIDGGIVDFWFEHPFPQIVERHMPFHVKFWADKFNERADDSLRMTRIIERWLNYDPGSARFKIAALAIRSNGSRVSLEVLARFSSTPDWGALESFFCDAEYGVMRRSLM